MKDALLAHAEDRERQMLDGLAYPKLKESNKKRQEAHLQEYINSYNPKTQRLPEELQERPVETLELGFFVDLAGGSKGRVPMYTLGVSKILGADSGDDLVILEGQEEEVEEQEFE